MSTILLGLHLPLLDSLAQTRDQRPLRKGERQRIFSSVGAHSVRPCLNLSAVSDNLLLHISAALRRRGMTVPRNSFARYYGRHLRALSDDKCYTVGCDDLGAPYLTIDTRYPVGEHIVLPRNVKSNGS